MPHPIVHRSLEFLNRGYSKTEEDLDKEYAYVDDLLKKPYELAKKEMMDLGYWKAWNDSCCRNKGKGRREYEILRHNFRKIKKTKAFRRFNVARYQYNTGYWSRVNAHIKMWRIIMEEKKNSFYGMEE